MQPCAIQDKLCRTSPSGDHLLYRTRRKLSSSPSQDQHSQTQFTYCRVLTLTCNLKTNKKIFKELLIETKMVTEIESKHCAKDSDLHSRCRGNNNYSANTDDYLLTPQEAVMRQALFVGL